MTYVLYFLTQLSLSRSRTIKTGFHIKLLQLKDYREKYRFFQASVKLSSTAIIRVGQSTRPEIYI